MRNLSVHGRVATPILHSPRDRGLPDHRVTTRATPGSGMTGRVPRCGMRRPHVLAIIQAGGAGSRMDVLTRERAKPALPFAGVFQLVDFPLSNLAHSGVDPRLAVGAVPGLDARGAGRQRPPVGPRPQPRRPAAADARRRAPAAWTRTASPGQRRRAVPRPRPDRGGRRRRRARDERRPRLPARLRRRRRHPPRARRRVHGGDHRGPDRRGRRPRGGRGGRRPGRCGFDYKPDDPDTGVVATEIFAYDPAVLVEALDELHRELGPEAEAGDTGLGDFGEHLLPRLVERGRTVAHRAARLLARRRPAAPVPPGPPRRAAPTASGCSATPAGRSSPTSRSARRRGSSTAPWSSTAW